MKLKTLKAIFASLILSVSGFANAGLMNVSTIEIESAVGSWLQISEIIAWDSISNTDLALSSAGATASATDYYLGNLSCSSNTSDASCVLNGSGPMAWTNIFHGGSGSGASILTITLATPSELSWFEILGRTDCCSSRDVYNVSMYDAQGVELFTAHNVSAFNQEHSTGRVNVPEPSTLAIFALAMIGLASRRFKK